MRRLTLFNVHLKLSTRVFLHAAQHSREAKPRIGTLGDPELGSAIGREYERTQKVQNNAKGVQIDELRACVR